MEYIQGPDRKKYIVENGKRFWIPDSLTRSALGLPISKFVNKSQTDIEAIDSEGNIDDVRKARLIRSIANPDPIYVVFTKPTLIKRHVPNPKTFWALGLNWNGIETLSQNEFDEIPSGDDIANYDDWEDDIKSLADRNIPRAKEYIAKVSFNSFGVPIETSDIPLLLKYTEKTADVVHDINDFKAHYLENFFGRPVNSLTDSILLRYIEITKDDTHVSIVPVVARITKQLSEPLASAKREYCFGEYLACIALCGVVGELLAVYLWNYSKVKINNTELNQSDERKLFTRPFQEQTQGRKIGILSAFDIGKDSLQTFSDLNVIRNRHLHPKLTLTSDDQSDAKNAFLLASALYKNLLGVNLEGNDKLILSPLLQKIFEEEVPKNNQTTELTTGL